MRIAWLTDIHLNFVNDDYFKSLLQNLTGSCDAVVITGDIGESPSIVHFLGEIERSLRMPIYFVLGNHDFYRGSIADTRELVTQLARESKHLVYLTAEDVIKLTPQTALVGHDGWADARLGDFDNSEIILNDYVLINELRFSNDRFKIEKNQLKKALHQLGDEAAEQLRSKLQEAARTCTKVILATHVPPFREATWHEGRVSDDHWLPHFSCKAVGDAILTVMRSNPECNCEVLCGHTHSCGEFQPSSNVNVRTGSATYGSPTIQLVFDLE